MLSRSSVHAIRALTRLAALPADRFAGAAGLAGEIGAPTNYLGKLLQTLANRGMLESRKGAGGGFRLKRSPDRVSLFDVVDPIDPTSRWEGCVLGFRVCGEQQPCAVHHRWGPLRDSYLAMLKETTIADIVRNLEEHGEAMPSSDKLSPS